MCSLEKFNPFYVIYCSCNGSCEDSFFSFLINPDANQVWGGTRTKRLNILTCKWPAKQMARVSSSTQTNTPNVVPNLCRLNGDKTSVEISVQLLQLLMTLFYRWFCFSKEKTDCLHFPVWNNESETDVWITENLWFYSLLCDKHLDHKDAEEDEGGTAHIVFEHGQVQGSVLEREKAERGSLSSSVGCTRLNDLPVSKPTCFSRSFLGKNKDKLPLSSDLDHCLYKRKDRRRVRKDKCEDKGNRKQRQGIDDHFKICIVVDFMDKSSLDQTGNKLCCTLGSWLKEL